MSRKFKLKTSQGDRNRGHRHGSGSFWPSAFEFLCFGVNSYGGLCFMYHSSLKLVCFKFFIFPVWFLSLLGSPCVFVLCVPLSVSVLMCVCVSPPPCVSFFCLVLSLFRFSPWFCFPVFVSSCFSMNKRLVFCLTKFVSPRVVCFWVSLNNIRSASVALWEIGKQDRDEQLMQGRQWGKNGNAASETDKKTNLKSKTGNRKIRELNRNRKSRQGNVEDMANSTG